MYNRIRYLTTKYLKGNTIIFIILLILIIIGLCAGAFWITLLSLETKNLLSTYMKKLFISPSINSINSAGILKNSIKYNILPVIFLFLLSITYSTIIFAPLYTLFRGFCLGFTIAFIIESFGQKGLLFVLAALVPQNIFYLPAIILCSYFSIELSLKMLKHRKDYSYQKRKKYYVYYIPHLALMIITVLISCIIESYITPVFIKAINYYI